MTPLSLIVDFDGTITTTDVGAALCDRFAPGVLGRVDRRWLSGEITFFEAYRLACLELRAPLADMIDHALEVGHVREGFGDLVETALSRGADFMVASAGLDLYVEPILRRELGPRLADVVVRANRARATAEGLAIAYPDGHVDCSECGNCKAAPARAARLAGRRVVGVGDSYSDRCLVRAADHVFARSWLADHCAEHAIDHSPFDDFHPVADLVRRLTS